MAATALAGVDRRAARAPPGGRVSAAIAVVGLSAAGISFMLAVGDGLVKDLGEPLVIAMLADWITLSYVLCGVVAWRRRPGSRFGLLMIVAGFANFASTLVWSTTHLLSTFGQALDLLPPVLFLHVFLAFPDGRLRGRFVRAFVVGAYASAIGLELVRMFFGEFGPRNLLELDANPAVADIVQKVQLTSVSGFCLTGVALLVGRRLHGGRPLRRSLDLLVDAFALSLVMIAFLLVSAAFDGPWVAQIRWATFVALGLAPAVFLTGLLHARLARSALGDLVVELHADLPPSDLRDALARATRDPSVDLAYWLPEFGTYADVDGRALDLRDLGRGRATTVIERNGRRVAALVHDSSLKDEPELLSAATAAAGMALENGRLQAELRARLEELRGSRARLLDAGQKERQRLERNLHDGAQQRLVALSLELSLLKQNMRSDPAAGTRLDRARQEIALSLQELRDIAHGLHPAVLSGHGLEVALESMVARAPFPVGLRVELDTRLEEPLEVAAYYVVSESLANTVKHAQASSASVAVVRSDGHVVVEVVDDGLGGADTERGTGLRSLADRVEALDGRLRVWTPTGGGTRVRAEIPCA